MANSTEEGIYQEVAKYFLKVVQVFTCGMGPVEPALLMSVLPNVSKSFISKGRVVNAC